MTQMGGGGGVTQDYGTDDLQNYLYLIGRLVFILGFFFYGEEIVLKYWMVELENFLLTYFLEKIKKQFFAVSQVFFRFHWSLISKHKDT